MEDPFVELARDCARTCHVLETVAEGSGVDDLSDPSRKQIENFGRCVDPAQPTLPTLTRCIRIIRHFESIVTERANCAGDLREHHPWPTMECLIVWRAEMLRVFDERGSQLTVPTASELPQGPGGGLEVSESKHVCGPVDMETPAPASIVVCCRFVPPRHSLLTVCRI